MSSFPAYETIWLADVDSTNRFALDSFNDLSNGTLIVARSQSAGRGSKGRSWSSPPDVNVYASLVLKDFPFNLHQASWIGSLSCLDVLSGLLPAGSLAVKWPNDVLCRRRKIAGILCEARSDGNGIVIGVGANINMSNDMLRAIGRPATSVFAETGVFQNDVPAITLAIRSSAMRLLAEAEDRGVDFLYRRWRAANCLLNSDISVQLPDGSRIQANVRDFEPDGAMTLREQESGRILHLANCDITSF